MGAAGFGADEVAAAMHVADVNRDGVVEFGGVSGVAHVDVGGVRKGGVVTTWRCCCCCRRMAIDI